MLKIESLPKDPAEALHIALVYAISQCRGENYVISELKQKNHPLANNLVVATIVILKLAQRLDSKEISRLIVRNSEIGEKERVSTLRAKLLQAQEAIIAYQLDAHLLDASDVKDFDVAELDAKDKDEIRGLMAKARQLVDLSEKLPVWKKRNVLHHIAKIESELHKEQSNFQAFLAAAADVSGLSKKFGEDVQPIADAIQTARTVTQRKIDGYEKLPMEEKPKQLPKPDGEVKRS